MRARLRTSLLAIVAGVAVVLAGTVTPAVAADAPTPAGTLAGPSTSAMYPSGLEYDAAGDRLVVADTGLDRVLLYSTAGAPLGSFGAPGADPGELSSPRDVAVGDDGSIYVADAENNRIQRFDAGGAYLSEVGGIGGCASCLNTPIGVTWDAANSVLVVASTGQSLIKAFHADLTLAWTSPAKAVTGLDGPRDAGRAPDGRLWVADYKHHQIKFFDVTPDGVWPSAPSLVLGDGLPGGKGDGQLNFPYNVVFGADGTTAYVSDTGNGRVARWTVDGTTATWLEPWGRRCDAHPQPCPDPPASAGEFNHLRRVAIDGAGEVYAADFWGGGIEVFGPDGTPARQIEGASAPLPGFAEAYGVDAGPSGEVYVMDRLNHRIQRFAPDGTFLGAAGARGTQPGTFSWPEALAVGPDGAVWAVDTRGGRIQRWPADLATQPAVPSWGAQGGAVGQMNWPAGVTVDGAGVVWVADTRNHRIQSFDPATETFAVLPVAAGVLLQPMGVAVTPAGIVVADTGHDRVVLLSPAGDVVAEHPGLAAPEGVAAAPDGTVWVADTGTGRAVQLDADLVPLGVELGGFDRPHSLSATASRLYVADTYAHRVEIFDLPDGGGPTPFDPVWQRHLLDPGGIATLYPAGAVADGAGGAFVADSGGSRIVHVGADGTLTPVSAQGWSDPRDLARDAGGGDLWVVDTGDDEVVRLTPGGEVVVTIGGPAELTDPYGLDAAPGAVYVADTYDGEVVRFDPETGGVVWSLGSCDGTAFSRPRDVAVAGDGNLYVADTDNDRVVAVAPDGSCLAAFGARGTGPGQFRSPRSIASDGSGGLWVGDAGNERVQHLDLTGAFIAQTGADAAFRQPSCVYSDGGELAVCDQWSWRIQRFTVDGDGTPHLAGTVGGLPPAPGGFNRPFDAAFAPNGELYAVDWGNHRIQRFSADGAYLGEWGGYGTAPGELIFPRAVAVTADGASVLVTNSEGNRLDLFTPDGVHVRSVRPTGTAFTRPHQTAIAADGSFWVADTLNDRVLHLDDTGTVLHEWGAGVLDDPKGIAIDAAGRVLVSDSRNDRVLAFDESGVLLATLTTDVDDPHHLLVSSATGEELVLVVDAGDDRVLALRPDGTPVGTMGAAGVGPGQLDSPRGVAMRDDGVVVVADHLNDRLSWWQLGGTPPVDGGPPDGTITSPVPGQVITSSSVTLTGTAIDDLAVASVRVAVQRSADKRWLRADGTFGSGFAWLTADVDGGGNWERVVELTPGAYGATVRVDDAAGNVDRSRPWVPFVVDAGEGDTTPPDGHVGVPAPGQEVTAGPVTLLGSATDDVAVAAVMVAVRDNATGRWLRADGTFGAGFAWLTAVLDAPGAASTAWSADIDLSPGGYGLLLRVDDAAGNTDPSRPWVSFAAVAP